MSEDPRVPGPGASRRYTGELRPYVDRGTVAAIEEVARQLADSRPPPRPGFQAELAAELAARPAAGGPGRRPRHLWAAIAGCACAGLGLLALAALGVSGAGPLG